MECRAAKYLTNYVGRGSNLGSESGTFNKTSRQYAYTKRGLLGVGNLPSQRQILHLSSLEHCGILQNQARDNKIVMMQREEYMNVTMK